MLRNNTSTAKAVFLSFVLFVSVLAMPMTGTVAATGHHDDTITANGEYEQGLVLLYSGATASTQVDLVQNGNTVETYTSSGSGEVWVETSNDDNGTPMEGTYSLVEGGSTLVTFSVTDTSQYKEITASNNLFWVGQTLTFDNQSNFASGEEVTIRVGGNGDDEGNFVQQYIVQSSGGDVVVDTDAQNLEGPYTIHDGSGAEVGSFEVVQQTMTVSPQDDQLSNEAGADTDTTFDFTSNRSGYTVQVTEGNDNLDAEEVGTVFGGSVAQTADATVSTAPSTTDDTSKHTVTADVTSGTISLNDLSVDYTNSDADISNVGAGDVMTVGIDRGGDSSGDTIDEDVSDSFNSPNVSNNGSTVTFDFDGSYSLDVGDEVVVVYNDVQNPSAQSVTDVPVDINTQSAGDEYTAFLYTNDNATDGAAYFHIDNTEDLDADFSSVKDGSYTFNFEVVDTGVSDTTSVGVDADSDASVDFSQSVYNEQQGDVVNVTVNTESANQFDVTFGDQDSDNYSQTATVDVDDNVSEVMLQFNTYEAGTGATPWSVHEDSANDASLSQSTDTNLVGDGPIDAGDYDIEASISGQIRDSGLVALSEGMVNGSTTHTAPDVSTINELEDLDVATENGTVAMKDKFVFQVEASGVYGFLNEDASAADLVEGSTFAGDNGVYVDIEETDPDANAEPVMLNVDEGTLITDAENDTFYLVFDEADFPDVEDDDQFDITFNVTEQHPYVEDDAGSDASDNSETIEKTSSSVTFFDREYTFDNQNDDDVVEVPAQAEADVTGTTTVAPGTEITVLARSGSPNAFTKTETMDVTEDRTFAATFDMSDANEDQEFELSLRGVDKTTDAIAVGGTQEETSQVTVNVENDAGETVNADVTVDGQTKTATDGSAMFQLADGDYTVSGVADGYQEVSQSVTVESETSTTLTLTEIQTVDYTVTVQDSEGAAVSGASVTVDGTTMTTDGSGQATFTLEEGSYTAQTTATEYQDSSSSITVGQDSTSTTVSLTAEQTDDGSSDDGDSSDGGSSDGDSTDMSDSSDGDSSAGDGSESGDSDSDSSSGSDDGSDDGGLPLPLIGGAVVIVVLLGLGGYYFTQQQN